MGRVGSCPAIARVYLKSVFPTGVPKYASGHETVGQGRYRHKTSVNPTSRRPDTMEIVPDEGSGKNLENKQFEVDSACPRNPGLYVAVVVMCFVCCCFISFFFVWAGSRFAMSCRLKLDSVH